MRYARAFADVVVDLKLDSQQVRDEVRALAELVELRLICAMPGKSRRQAQEKIEAC